MGEIWGIGNQIEQRHQSFPLLELCIPLDVILGTQKKKSPAKVWVKYRDDGLIALTLDKGTTTWAEEITLSTSVEHSSSQSQT